MLKKIRKFSSFMVAAYAVHYTSIVSKVMAQGAKDFLPPNKTGSPDFISFVQSAINLAIGIAGLIAVGFLVYSGIQYIVAAGDESKVEKATKGITYAVVGLIVCFISVLIVNFVIDKVLKAT